MLSIDMHQVNKRPFRDEKELCSSSLYLQEQLKSWQLIKKYVVDDEY